jgi:hypothetical protein
MKTKVTGTWVSERVALLPLKLSISVRTCWISVRFLSHVSRRRHIGIVPIIRVGGERRLWRRKINVRRATEMQFVGRIELDGDVVVGVCRCD